jgi:hypothetical protein
MNDTNLHQRAQRGMELILEDEVFMSRIEKFSKTPEELLKRIEGLVEKKAEELLKIPKDDEAYLAIAKEIRKIKNQILNELKNQKDN